MPLANSSNACHTPLFDDHITCLEFKLLGVVSEVVWRDFHSLGGDCQLVRFAAFLACPAYYGCHVALVVDLGSCSAAYREACSAFHVGDLGASVAYEPCEAMHDKTAKNCLILVAPCCSPCHC